MRRAALLLVIVGALGALAACGRSELDDLPSAPVASHPDAAPARPDARADQTGKLPADAGTDRARDVRPPIDARPPEPCGGPCPGGTRCVRGGLTPGQVWRTGKQPLVVLAAILDEDQTVDLVVANGSSSEPSMFLGLGDGTVVPVSTFTTGTGQFTMAAGDFDGDGIIDLAFSDYSSLTTWKGLDNGTFLAGQRYPAAPSPAAMIAADLDGDGALDLVLTYTVPSQLRLFRGDGRGGFLQVGPPIPTGGGMFVTTVDFDHDATLDLVLAEPGPDDVRVLLGNGDGTFGAVRIQRTGRDPTVVALADLDMDGNVDIATDDMRAVGLLFGDGIGGFRAGFSMAAGPGVNYVVSADFDGDGRADLAVSGAPGSDISGQGYVGVLLGNGDGSFQPMQTLQTGSFPVGMVAADLNGDGHPDLAVVDQVDDILTIFLWDSGYACR